MTNIDVALPKFFRLRQRFESHAIEDVTRAVAQTIADANLDAMIRPGQRVAIAVGSRGIANLPTIVAAVVHCVRGAGGDPLIVPAMGSHGGARADGQEAMLASFGVTESDVSAPIVSSMQTVVVGNTKEGLEIHFDRVASQADHVILVNRIKPHTRLVGDLESGLAKMLMIGLGKHRGAELFHQTFSAYDYRLDPLASTIVPMIIHCMPITLGLAIVEDAYEQTSLIEAVAAEKFLAREPELLKIAKSRMPKLPFDHADLLIIDKIGKEISGTGMDTNVIGRKSNDKIAAPDEFPKVKQIYVRGLTEKTAGNATGIGIAEYCHRRVVELMDAEVTRINCEASDHVSAGEIPLTLDSDRDVLDAVLSHSGTPTASMRWLWIANTLHVSELACSEAFWSDAHDRADLEIVSDLGPLEFDSSGDLIGFFG